MSPTQYSGKLCKLDTDEVSNGSKEPFDANYLIAYPSSSCFVGDL